MIIRVFQKNIFFSDSKSEITPGVFVLGKLKYQISDFYLEKWAFAGILKKMAFLHSKNEAKIC